MSYVASFVVKITAKYVYISMSEDVIYIEIYCRAFSSHLACQNVVHPPLFDDVTQRNIRDHHLRCQKEPR